MLRICLALGWVCRCNRKIKLKDIDCVYMQGSFKSHPFYLNPFAAFIHSFIHFLCLFATHLWEFY